MDELVTQIAATADKVLEMSELRNGHSLDFHESSLAVIEDMLEETSKYFEEMTTAEQDTVVQDFGCYILEVARREFGGSYAWHDDRDQPVLVVEKPKVRVALITWDKVRSRLAGDTGDNIPFFYSGFVERVRKAEPGTDALYV
jgi:hypothetical protein